ncbi:hypothetical protein PGT21_012621 [Puccinia graminis f. sp. tritici]|uniref:Uncharacterized protein n=1 Tax=Puccinia graminis f. sp. tritici TaxID=56615 RepID=A0A5B0PCL6_PUCGR|nr:hypothetical protein PGT21_012621 [Puccinia graminis f. sp. tritici]KAA1134031.1 hypothetical protein PGTUg99_018233 [Puccinia graminis f. sp. tritici]
MHFVTLTITFLAVTCGLATAQQPWRDTWNIQFHCPVGQLALCFRGHSAIVATPVTRGSGNPKPTTFNCYNSNADSKGCCPPGTGGVLSTWSPWTALDAHDYNSCTMNTENPPPPRRKGSGK